MDKQKIGHIQGRFTWKAILSYFAVATIFGEGFTFQSEGFFDIRLTYFIMPVVLLFLIGFLKKLNFNKVFLIILGLFSFFSLINITLDNVNINDFLKQAFGIFLNSLFFYTVIKFNEADIKRLFLIYIRIALVIAIIGILQEIGYLLKLKFLYDFKAWLPNWRYPMRFVGNFLSINSIMPEPSSFCIALLPAFIVSLLSLVYKNLKLVGVITGMVIITAFILSFSSLGYLGLFFLMIILALQCMNLRKFIIAVIFISLLTMALYETIPVFQVRVKDTLRVITAQKKLADVNLSTFTLFNNAQITKEVFFDNFLFGHGLGSHERSFNVYNKYAAESNRPLLNKKDANSLFLRLLSETGIIGIGIFLIFLFRCFIMKKRNENDYLWAINISIFVFLIIRLIRFGNYSSEGFFFFFWLYFFTKIIQQKQAQWPQASE